MAYNDIDSGKVLNKEGLLELSGQIKGYIEDNIPQAYTLPTASTTALGGVKVDGETITISDGVISAVGGGDTTKIINVTTLANILEDEALDTALQEIQTALHNNGTVNYVVYLDNILATPIGNSNNTYPKLRILNNGKFLNYTPTSANGQVYYYSTTNYALDSSNVSVPTANQIGSKYTVAETFGYIKTNYATKDYVDVKVPDISTTATDGVYKLTSTITSGSPTYAWEEDSGNSGSGATYTAGSGIDITNNVISNNMPIPTDLLFGSIYASLASSNSEIANEINGSFTYQAVDANEFIDYAKKSVWFFNTYGDNFTGANYTNLKNQLGVSTIRKLSISSSGVVKLSTQNTTLYYFGPEFLYYKFVKINQLGLFISIANIYDLKYLYQYLNPVPPAPTTDGDYVLKVSVSSGTPTYSWVEATTGGSY